MKTALFVVSLLALAGACSLETPDTAGPDGGAEVPQLADPDEIALCPSGSLELDVRMASRTHTSITVDVDIDDPSCRWLASPWELWEANLPDFPYLTEQLASGTGSDLPFRYTHAGLLPGKRYCIAARYRNSSRFYGDCFYTEQLEIKRWW